MGKISIFGASGGVSRSVLDDSNISYRYVSIDDDSGTGKLHLRAPSSGVEVTEAVDTAIHKALSGSLLIACFGPSPVKISISGLDMYGLRRCADTSDSTIMLSYKENNMDDNTILKFYKENNIGRNKLIRVGVSDGGKGNAAIYKCALTSLTRTATGTTPGVGRYSIQLLGVRIS